MISASTAPLVGQSVLFDVVVTLAAAVVLGMLLQRLRQSAMLGYLLAGLLLGPGALGVIRDAETLSFMGELGVALLLFTIGLELPWQRIQRLGRATLIAGIIQVVLTIALGTAFLHWHGAGWGAAAALAMAISMSSTAVVIRMLADRAETDSVHGLAAIGMLLAQDLAVVALLLVVPQLGGASGGGVGVVLAELGISFVKLGALIALMWLFESVIMRRMFRNAALGAERELLALSAFVISLGSVGACYALELSPALGGFVAGVIMAGAPYADQVRADTAPVRMGLVALFFAWIGMLADLGWIVEHPAQIVGAVLGIVVAKWLLTILALRIMRVASFVAILTGAALAQMGEFSFAIMATAERADVVTNDQFQLFVSASLVTLLISPSLLSLASRLVRRVAEFAEEQSSESAGGQGGHAVVVGYGPAGQGAVRGLLGAGMEVIVIELNPRVHYAPTPGVHVVYGDAAQPEILARARVRHARLVVVTIPEPGNLRRMVRQVRALAPDVLIVARGRYNIYLGQIREAGADVVVDEETAAGSRLAEESLDLLHRAASGLQRPAAP